MAHGAVASRGSEREKLVEAVLEDWRTAPIDERLRAALAFLETLTLSPEQVGPSDVAPMRRAGISDEGIQDVIAICALFGLATRMADALDFEIPDSERLDRFAGFVSQAGYSLPTARDLLARLPGFGGNRSR